MGRTLGSAHIAATCVTFSALILPSWAGAQEAVTEGEVPPASEEAEPETPPTGDEQQPQGEEPEEGASEAASRPPAVVGPTVEPVPDAEADAQSQKLDALLNKVETLESEVTSLRAAQEEAEVAALLQEESVEVQQEVFKAYGFMDMGLQRLWGGELMEATFNANALTFVVGNVNLYFDVNPHPDWRGLAEIRFTLAPTGTINQYGGTDFITQEEIPFERENTQQFDPHATAANSFMWGSYTVMERAWIEWKRFQQFKLRLGHFFTPFGIWNVDHGQPTLIAATTPQFIQQMYMPLRQTGLQALGSFFAGSWEIAYRAWLTNGRNEIAVQDLYDDKAFGGRVFVRKDGGDVRLQVGASYHHGRVRDKSFDATFEVNPDGSFSSGYDSYSTFDYVENIFGGDVSLDVGDFRLRAEGTSFLREYEDGKRPFGIGGLEADGWRWSVYGLAAYQLPFWGLEPFVSSELMKLPQGGTDRVFEIAPGLNIRFNPQVTFKTQVTRSIFFQSKGKGDNQYGNLTSLVTRLVLAF